MRGLVLDIETAPQARALAMEYPALDRLPPANYKNEDAIARWREADTRAWRDGLAKAASLNPRIGRVVAVGVGDEELVGCNEQDERGMVVVALNEIGEEIGRRGRVVTYNGLAFDLPFLHARAAVLGVRIPYGVGDVLRRYTTQHHADLFAALSNWGRAEKGDTLTGWCEAFGIECTDETTGADIGDAVTRGDEAFIRAHLASDCRLTMALGEKLEAAGLI